MIINISGYEYEIDDEDYDYINKWSWYIKDKNQNQFYLKAGKLKDDPVEWPAKIYLHRTIMQRYYKIEKIDIDHIDGNVFNNKKSNLRLATDKQNSRNRTKKADTKNNYIGVNITSVGTFHASIQVDGKYYGLGTYESEKDAAMARDQAARYFYGEFAKLNFPDQNTQIINLERRISGIKTQDRKHRKRKNEYKGVIYVKNTNMYQAQISLNGKSIHIGTFRDKETAAKAHDQIERYLFKEDACLNFPEEEYNIININEFLKKINK